MLVHTNSPYSLIATFSCLTLLWEFGCSSKVYDISHYLIITWLLYNVSIEKRNCMLIRLLNSLFFDPGSWWNSTSHGICVCSGAWQCCWWQGTKQLNLLLLSIICMWTIKPTCFPCCLAKLHVCQHSTCLE